MSELGIDFNPIQIPPEGMQKSPWAYSANPGKMDADKIANLNVDTITVSTDGYIRSGKTDFTDTDVGWYLGSEGVYLGDTADATKFKFNTSDGSMDFIGNITITGNSTDALTVKKGGDIFIEGDDIDPGKLVFRDGNNTSKSWEFYMDVDTTADFLYLIPNDLTYRDVWMGKFGTGGTNAQNTSTAIRNFFINTGNDLSGGSRPSIVFQNWNAYGGYFSSVSIGNSDSESLVEIQGNLLPSANDSYNLGSSAKGWSRLYFTNNESVSESDGDIRFTTSIGVPSTGKIIVGLTSFVPKTLNYQDHSGVNQTMTVLGY